jgi:hypothetical protein
VEGPYDSFFKSMRLIRKRLVEFIILTRDTRETPRELVFDVLPSGAKFAINKYASSGDWVAAAMHSDGGGWGYEIVTELQLLVQAAVNVKAEKLREVRPPWVLLLLDRHHAATADEYASVHERLRGQWALAASNAKLFHSICIVQASGDVFSFQTGTGIPAPSLGRGV